jgi:glutamate-1-semialdehyde 2,1-aminomutase
MKHSVSKSWELAKTQRAHLACGSSTNSKRPQLEGDEPALIVRGKGCRVWDVDGNQYIDFRGGLGPVSIGYAIPEINAAIAAQLEDGVCFGQPHPLEGEVAGLLHEVIPCAEKARFLKTGGEAVAACIKIARGATGRDLVVHCGYNGWLSSIARPRGKVPVGIAASKPHNGVPAKLAELHLSLPWAVEAEWTELFAARGREIAAVVVACDYAEMDKAATFLPFLRDLTRKEGSLLVFDEIVTGFRLALGGAQERFKVTPDLAAVGKGVANGIPLSAYVGRADLMESSATLGISSTFGGDALALAAAKATIRFYREHDVIAHLWKAGTDLWPRVQGLLDESKVPGTVKGAPVCPQLGFDTNEHREAFFRAAYRNGLSLYDVSYVTWSHREADIRETLDRFKRVVKEISTR